MLAFEDRVKDVVDPFAFEPLGLLEMPLAAHPDALEESNGAYIPVIRNREDTVKTELCEHVLEEMGNRFRRQALALSRASERKTQFRLPRVAGPDAKPAVPDVRSCLPKFDRDLRPVTRLKERQG